MRISYWSSDVCSSDLTALGGSSYQNTSQSTNMELLLKYFFKINTMNFAIKVAIFVIVLGDFRLSRMSQVMPQDAWPKAIVVLSSDARRVGQEYVSTCRSRGSPYT